MKKIIEVAYDHFIFSPHFNLGQYESTFSMVVWLNGRCMTTSGIISLRKVEDIIYVETQNTLYQICNIASVKHYAEVKACLEKKISSNKFYNNYILDKSITADSWKVY